MTKPCQRTIPANLVRERLKSYPWVSEISLSWPTSSENDWNLTRGCLRFLDLDQPRQRTIEILLEGVWDFSILTNLVRERLKSYSRVSEISRSWPTSSENDWNLTGGCLRFLDLDQPRQRTIEILLEGVWDFSILTNLVRERLQSYSRVSEISRSWPTSSENDCNLTRGCLRFLDLDLSPVLDSIILLLLFFS